MEVSHGSVYLYDFTTYEQLMNDVEILMDINADANFSLYSRMPTRRLIEKLDLSKINNYLISNMTKRNTLSPNIDEILTIIRNCENNDVHNVHLIDGLELIYDNSDKQDLLRKLTGFIDEISNFQSTLIVCVDNLALDSSWIIKLASLTQKLTIKAPKLTAIEESDSTIEEIESTEQIQYELGIDGGPRLAYLSRLPKIGFTREILVKRILQWRRMGLDVSVIEPSLSYDTVKAFELYQEVEELVRRATELERFIHANAGDIDATQVTTDMFRIRQLTGLDELEKKYY